MILCKDCVFCSIHTGDPAEFAKCDAPQNLTKEIEPVTGKLETKRKHVYCTTVRSDIFDNVCGPDAEWFEALNIVEEECEAEPKNWAPTQDDEHGVAGLFAGRRSY